MGYLTLEEFKATGWFKERPQIIKDLIVKVDPTVLQRIKSTGEIVQTVAFYEDGTIRVQKLGIGGPLDHIIGPLKTGWGVFGLKPEDLEALTWEESVKIKDTHPDFDKIRK